MPSKYDEKLGLSELYLKDGAPASAARALREAALYLDRIAAERAQLMPAKWNPMIMDWSASGGPEVITVAEAVTLAAAAKTKVKGSARGATNLSLHEIIALAWFADFHLVDTAADMARPPVEPPATISNL